jgi:Zn-dependent peptidase ImmA (M78 family)/transcriptional regulator with XRE-family HTH domain
MERRDEDRQFRGDLLRLGRQARRMTQKQLAESSGVTQAFVSMVEEQQRVPSETQAETFARALTFPLGFFLHREPLIGTGIGEVFHRARKSMNAKDLEQVHAWRNISTLAIRQLLQAVEWPQVDVPTWSLGSEVDSEELAAEALRAKWYVPSGPIESVTDLLDRSGVLIVPLAFSSPEMDAIGQWSSGLPPMVFVNPSVPQDRLRFTLMHEIGHLVLHQWSLLPTVSEEIETQANLFAAAFLMPSKEIKPHLRNLTVSKLASLKRHWRVAMSALLMRAKQLGTVTPVQERALWAELGRNGWRKREPEQLDVFGEDPGRRYHEVFSLYQRDLSFTAEQLGVVARLYQDDIYEFLLLPQPGLRLIRQPVLDR